MVRTLASRNARRNSATPGEAPLVGVHRGAGRAAEASVADMAVGRFVLMQEDLFE